MTDFWKRKQYTDRDRRLSDYDWVPTKPVYMEVKGKAFRVVPAEQWIYETNMMAEDGKFSRTEWGVVERETKALLSRL